jgi:transposase
LAQDLLAGCKACFVIADMAYDADAIRSLIAELGAVAVIPSHPARARALAYDEHLYKERHLVECFFNKIKRFRRIALRAEKTLVSFRAFFALAATMIWLA